MKYLKQPMILSLLGPACLLLGLFSILLKVAQGYWPLFTVAFCSFFCIWRWKRIGFFLSLALGGAGLGIVWQNQDRFWPTLLAFSIALSGLLFLLGREEELSALQQREEAMDVLREDNNALLLDLKRLETITSRDQKEMAEAFERVQQELHAASRYMSTLEAQVAKEMQEKQELSLEISSYQRKERAFQHALEDAQTQLIKCKHEKNQEEDKSVQLLYAQLKEQFEEKSEVLHQTRKELFAAESLLLYLEKEELEKASAEEQTVGFVQKLYAEYEDMEVQIAQLQDLVSVLVQPRKLAPRKRKNTKEAQEDLLDLLRN